ncbi:unnamed protein product [Moneuplotes crassus]|uniref:Uncharacterized protein n=1 Tax=Euplotes crassus TaxID=5936 RepID=A0AAD1Y7B8_EUPCR|nr:unnamed protein product [Moneuplotes crassus]
MEVDTTKQLEPQHKKYSSSKMTVREKKVIKNMVTKRSSKKSTRNKENCIPLEEDTEKFLEYNDKKSNSKTIYLSKGYSTNDPNNDYSSSFVVKKSSNSSLCDKESYKHSLERADSYHKKSDTKILSNSKPQKTPITAYKSSSTHRKRKPQSKVVKRGSVKSSSNLPPKTASRHTKYNNYFSHQSNNQLNRVATKNMNTMIKDNICQGSHFKKNSKPCENNTSRHLSSISFSSSAAHRDSSKISSSSRSHKPSKKPKKSLYPKSLLTYTSSNYTSSNIIKMLRAKQQSSTHPPKTPFPHIPLSTSSILPSQPHQVLYPSSTGDQNPVQISQIPSYADLIELCCASLEGFESKFQTMSGEIRQLCRINYKAVELYKQIMDELLGRREKGKEGMDPVVYKIFEMVKGYLENEDSDISKFERSMQDNLQFIEKCDETLQLFNTLKETVKQSEQPHTDISFHSPKTSLNFQNSYSRIPKNQACNRHFNSCKQDLLLKNPSMANCTEDKDGKSRNTNTGALSSKTFAQEGKYEGSTQMKDQNSVKQFNQKVFQSAENYQKKLDSIDDIFQAPVFDSGKKDFEGQRKESLDKSKILEPSCDTKEEGISNVSSIHPTSEEYSKINKLLEDLSVMILSSQKSQSLDQQTFENAMIKIEKACTPETQSSSLIPRIYCTLNLLLNHKNLPHHSQGRNSPPFPQSPKPQESSTL